MSGYVALRLPLPEAVVTYFVTGSRTLIPSECTIVGTGESKGAAMLMVPRPVNRTPQLRSADKLIGCPATGGDVGDPIAVSDGDFVPQDPVRSRCSRSPLG